MRRTSSLEGHRTRNDKRCATAERPWFNILETKPSETLNLYAKSRFRRLRRNFMNIKRKTLVLDRTLELGRTEEQ